MQHRTTSFPDPLHPAVVHFPIVLPLIGAGVAVVSVFVDRWNLTWISAALLVMGAVGAFVAVETGEDSREIQGKLVGDKKQLVDDHQEWAERTEIAACITATLAALAAAGTIAARLTAGKVKIFRWAVSPNDPPRPADAYCGNGASFMLLCLSNRRRGGELVYEHGIGVNVAIGQLERDVQKNVSSQFD